MPEVSLFKFIGGMADGQTLRNILPKDLYGWPPPDTLLMRANDEGFEVMPLETGTLVDVTGLGIVHVYERNPERTSVMTEEQARDDPLFARGAEYMYAGEST